MHNLAESSRAEISGATDNNPKPQRNHNRRHNDRLNYGASSHSHSHSNQSHNTHSQSRGHGPKDLQPSIASRPRKEIPHNPKREG